MTQLHGKAVTSEDVERLTGRDFGSASFASMCNAIVWASAKKRPTSLPSFTERVNVRDKGIDAEWDIELPEDGYSSPLLGPGSNIFQYKQRDVAALGREALISRLKSDLTGAVEELNRRAKRRPDRYVLFTNLDLMHDQKRELKKKILEGYVRQEDVAVEIAGAAEIATFLTDMPHLRYAYLGTPSFSAVEAEWTALASRRPFGAGVELIGREEEMDALSSFFEDMGARAMVVAGPQGIGKTRLVLEAASRDRPYEAVVAIDPQSLSLADVLELRSSDTEGVLIVDDPDPDKAEELVHGVLAVEGLKLLIVLPTPENAPAPSFGQDERVLTLKLPPLSTEQAMELLRMAGSGFDFGVEHWVIERAGGNPDVLLAAAGVGPDLRTSATSFAEAVGKGFERRVKRELGEAALRKLELLSLLPQVGVAREAVEELEAVIECFGDGMSTNEVLRSLDELIAAGLVRPRGSYVEVTPAFFANYLCAAALRGRASELVSLFAALGYRAKRRMLRRLQTLTVDEVALFWDALLRSGGPLQDLPSAWSYPDLLCPAASVEPKRFADMVWAGLSSMSREERLEITGEERRQLIFALQECLYRVRTAETALNCLGLLAEAETETYGNNAIGVFCESFRWSNPQFPLSLTRRLLLLREIFEEENTLGLRLVAVQAIESSIPQRGMVLFVSQGPMPLDAAPPMTRDEVSEYVEGLVALLIEVARSEDVEIADAASNVLPRSIATSAFYARPEVAVERLGTVVGWALTQEVPIPISDLASQLRGVRDGLGRATSPPQSESAAGIRRAIVEVEVLIERLDAGSFPVRLKMLGGEWTLEDYEYEVDEHGKQIYRGTRKLRDLAREAMEKPEVLTEELMGWLCSPKAKNGSMFFHQFGKLDKEMHWLPTMESLGIHREGAALFAAYLGGLGEHDRAFVENRLDELMRSGKVTDEAILRATGCLGGSPEGVERVATLVQEGRVNARLVEWVLPGRWSETLTAGGFLRLLQALPDMLPEAAMVAVHLGSNWEAIGKPVEGVLADHLLQRLASALSRSHYDDHLLDQLAAALARRDNDGGFRLFEELLSADEPGWDPVEVNRENLFWGVLRDTDRERLLRLVVSLAAKERPKIFGVVQVLQGVLDQRADKDLLVTLAMENERQAEIIANGITAAKAGFWTLAVKLLERYPHNEIIQSGVELGARRIQGGTISYWGSSADQTESVLTEVMQVLEDDETPEAARSWLEQFASSLREKAERERIEEADKEIDL